MLLFRLIAAFLAINIAATVPLWFGERSFPPAPLLLASRNLDAAALLFGSLFLLFGCLGLGRTMFRWLFLACAFVLICSDQNRLQPWFYQYAVLLFLLWELRAGETQRSGRDTLLAAILGTIYFWSGAQKFNYTFLTEGVTWFSDPLSEHFPIWGGLLALALMLAPLLELLIGLGFFTRHYRRSALAATLMHVFILALIGPLGRGWNSAVWPWNVAMMLLNGYLLANRELLTPWRLPAELGRASRAVLFGFVLLPITSFIGMWDLYLSFALYSWNTPAARFELGDGAGSDCLPAAAARHFTGTPPAAELLDWSLTELNVPPIPERRLFHAVGKELCRHCPHGRLFIAGKPEIFSGRRESSILRCEELLEPS